MVYDCDSELRLVLVGKTGSGKSSTGNTILGKAFRVDSSSDTVTKESGRGYRELEGNTVTVIDSPGLVGLHLYKTVKAQKEEAISLVYLGPHVFLLVIKVGNFTGEEKNTVEWIVENFGEETLKHTYILFTHGNKNQNEDNNRKEMYIKQMYNIFQRKLHGYSEKLIKDAKAVVKKEAAAFQKSAEMDNPFVTRRKSLMLPPEVSDNLRRMYQIKRNNSSDSDMKIVLLDKTGSGKISTGNTIPGKDGGFILLL